MKTHSLSHVAMSVPPGTLTDAYRKEVLDFYGELFDWREMEELRLPDRLTLAVGSHFYVNLRERPNAATITATSTSACSSAPPSISKTRGTSCASIIPT